MKKQTPEKKSKVCEGKKGKNPVSIIESIVCKSEDFSGKINVEKIQFVVCS